MKNSEYGPLLLRLTIGIMFLYQGIGKLMNPSGPTGMLTNLGFPIPQVFAWILLLSEIIFGLAVLVGYKVKYSVWPLVLIFLVVIGMVVLPAEQFNVVTLFFHIIVIAGLISLSLTGPGKLAIGRNFK